MALHGRDDVDGQHVRQALGGNRQKALLRDIGVPCLREREHRQRGIREREFRRAAAAANLCDSPGAATRIQPTGRRRARGEGHVDRLRQHLRVKGNGPLDLALVVGSGVLGRVVHVSSRAKGYTLLRAAFMPGSPCATIAPRHRSPSSPMIVASLDLPTLLEAALDAARAASSLVEEGWRQHPASEHKRARVDLVTRFDRDSEALLRERLARAAPFPVVGEEEGGEPARGSHAPTWYVDPLDGTTNFVHGHPFWCVSVGLLAGIDPVLGVVVAPSLHLEWTGMAGRDARRNGAACRVSDVAQLDDALLATGFPYDRRTSEDNNFDTFVAIKRKCQAVRRCGSAAIDMCLVADGTYDGYWEKKLGSWDVAAGSAIVLAAAGRISDDAGRPANVTQGNVVATNGRIHDELVTALGAAMSVR
jgi:myo-inositol-1(or 4)-monophosphatase